MLRRAVFSDIQRKGLEKRFHIQKYISKPDRKKLADQLGLKDSQVRNILISGLSSKWGVSGEDLVSEQEDEVEENKKRKRDEQSHILVCILTQINIGTSVLLLFPVLLVLAQGC